jgi:hypothetical protein
VAIRVNGGNYMAMQRDAAISTDLLALNVSGLAALAVGDYLELEVWQNSGGALNVNYNASYSPYFWAVMV